MFTWPKNPPFLHPPTIPKFPFEPSLLRTNPPPVVKSHGLGSTWAFTTGMPLNINTPTRSPPVNRADTSLAVAPLLIASPPFPSRPLCAALRNARGCERNHHTANATDGNVKRIHHAPPGRSTPPLLTNHLTP